MSDIDLSIYAKAADVIRERGHNPSTWGLAEGPVCVEGALNLACGNGHPRVFSAASETVAKPLWDATCSNEGGLFTWNWRATAEDAILLLKHAAADELDTWRELYGPGAS